MVQKSAYSSTGFTVNYYDRLPKGGSWLGDIDVSLENWRHAVSSFGGFDTASFELSENQDVMEDWAQNGLFRTVTVHDNHLNLIWEGFVDSITINQAGLSITHGPVTDIANRIFAIYSGVDTSVYPPEIGVRKRTPTFNNLDSQSLWGIWHEILSLAGVSDSNADQLVEMYLTEHAHAEVNGDFSFSNDSVSLSISCVGWYKTLNYPFNYTATGGDVAISARIGEIVAAQPNSWISSDYSRIVANATAVSRYENDDQLAIEQIRGLTAMGDTANNRHIFGIYEDRQVIYEQFSQEIDYIIELGNPRQLIYNSAGAIVDPWMVRPGKWAFFSDFMSGLGTPYENLYEDPRMLQIEQTQFDIRTPFGIQMTGGHTSKYEQRSARLGLRGINA